MGERVEIALGLLQARALELEASRNHLLKEGRTAIERVVVNNGAFSDQLLGADGPADLGARRAEHLARRADRHGPLPHARQSGQTRVRSLVGQVLVDLVRYAQSVVLDAQLGHFVQLLARVDLSQGVVGRVYHDQLGLGVERRLELSLVPFPVRRGGHLRAGGVRRRLERHVAALGAREHAHRRVTIVERLHNNQLQNSDFVKFRNKYILKLVYIY